MNSDDGFRYNLMNNPEASFGVSNSPIARGSTPHPPILAASCGELDPKRLNIAAFIHAEEIRDGKQLALFDLNFMNIHPQ